MKQRCSNPNCNKYKNYGARGITYHPDFADFIKWWEHIQPMWEKFVEEHPNETPSIDRIDSTGNYTPGNIQIISLSENSKRVIQEHGYPTPEKPVIATCKKNGKEIWFPSASEAERQEYADQGDISNCCRGKGKSAGGYTWRYA